MAAGFTFIGELAGHDYAALVNGALIVGGLTTAGFIAKRSLQTAEDPILPEDKFSCRMLFETVTKLMLSVGDSAMGKENRRYLPFVSALFFYLLVINLLGLVPGSILSTDNYQFDAGIALVVFVMYNFWGVKELGLGKYLAHFWMPGKAETGAQLVIMIMVGFILFPIEIMSHLIRPLTLSLRIFGNMSGDHSLIGAFNSLAEGSYAFFNLAAFPFYFLGTLVCFIQAFIFALLTMVYIRLAVAH